MSRHRRAATLASIVAAAAAGGLVLLSSGSRASVSPDAAPYASPSPMPQPRLFAEGVISTADDELGGTFTPDGRDFYFARRTPSTIVSSLVVILVSHFRDGRWSHPEIAPFSGQYVDFGPAISPDGSRLYFASVRPVDGKERTDADIWFVEKQPDGSWGPPVDVGPPVNSPGPEQSPCPAADGSLYFASVREGGKGSYDLYRSRRIDGRFAEPESLGDAINTENPETHPFLARDGSFLLFSSTGRPDSPVGPGSPYPRPDLYVSESRDGKWTSPRRLGAPINTDASETGAFVSPDGRYLFFTSERNFTSIPMPPGLTLDAMQSRIHRTGNGLGDVYQMDLAAAGLAEGGR